MAGAHSRRPRSLRLSPVGWGFAVALIVLVVLAIVAPSTGVFVGLAVVILVWVALLNSSFPAVQARGMSRGEAGETDWGQQAEDEYERKYGHKF